MAQQTINVPAEPTAAPNTRDTTKERGDSWRDLLQKLQDMFTEVYGWLGDLLTNDVRWLVGDAAPTDNAQASLTTDLGVADADLKFTAVAAGADGNEVSIAYVDPGANDAELEVVVDGNVITFNLATGVAGAITSTADEIKAALLANAEASALVTAADDAGNDGSGIVTEMAETSLAGGTDGSGRGVAGTGSLYSDTDTPAVHVNTGTKDAPVWAALATA